MASSRSLTCSLPLVLLAALGGACGDDSAEGGLAGSTSIGGGTGGAPGGAGGDSASGGSGGSVVGGSGGSAGAGVTPDPLKDCAAPESPGVPELVLTELASGLERPIYLAQARGDTERLFVVEKPGRVRILRGGAVVETPFLTVPNVSERGGEMGLLGFAFHPQYADNGRFYVYYSTIADGSHISRIAEYRVSSDNPDAADAASARVLLEVSQPQDNHNGGDLEFGPDGFLYVGLGDGGGGGDNHGAIGNGQNLGTLLGKILRLDVDGTGGGDSGNYAVPPGNISAEGALPEIWSYGLRNPWRFSFDGCTGDMYIADVGQGDFEEIDFEPAGLAGRNYGWRLMEGDTCFNPDEGCDAEAQNLVLPVATYGRNLGQSITGGYVYRGSAIAALKGAYIYADYASSRFFALRMGADGTVAEQQVDISDNINPVVDGDDRQISGITSFGQDGPGNVYVLTFDGGVYRIDAE
jgi:glucose/arabinose dehydrogenase